jgi:hypothetical protein
MVTTEQQTVKRINVPELLTWFQETGWKGTPYTYIDAEERVCCVLGGMWLRDHDSDGSDYTSGSFLHAQSLGFDESYLRGVEHGFMGYGADEDDGKKYALGIEDGQAVRTALNITDE